MQKNKKNMLLAFTIAGMIALAGCGNKTSDPVQSAPLTSGETSVAEISNSDEPLEGTPISKDEAIEVAKQVYEYYKGANVYSAQMDMLIMGTPMNMSTTMDKTGNSKSEIVAGPSSMLQYTQTQENGKLRIYQQMPGEQQWMYTEAPYNNTTASMNGFAQAKDSDTYVKLFEKLTMVKNGDDYVFSGKLPMKEMGDMDALKNISLGQGGNEYKEVFDNVADIPLDLEIIVDGKEYNFKKISIDTTEILKAILSSQNLGSVDLSEQNLTTRTTIHSLKKSSETQVTIPEDVLKNAADATQIYGTPPSPEDSKVSQP